MREGQFFARALGSRRWSRFLTKAIRGESRRPPGGPGCLASALWPGSGSGLGARKSRTGVNSFRVARILETASFRYYYYPIIISSNYGPNRKGTKAKRTRKETRGSLRLDDPCKAVGRLRPALVPGRCLSGLRRRQGELACLAGTRGLEARRA